MELPAKILLFPNGKHETYLELKKGTDTWIAVTEKELDAMAKRKKPIKISKEAELDFDEEAKTTARSKLKSFLKAVVAKKQAKMSESREIVPEKILTKGYYDKLLKDKQLEYERWRNQKEKDRLALKRALTSAEFQAVRDEDAAFTKEINKLKKLRKAAPLDAVSEEDYPRFASKPPAGVDTKKLFIYGIDRRFFQQKETRTGKPRPSPIYELVQESPPRFKLAYDKWSGGSYPYQTPSKAAFILREAEVLRDEDTGNIARYVTTISRGERKGQGVTGSDTDLYPYTPSERELKWLRTGKYE